MIRSDGFAITKPLSVWNRAIRTDFKSLFLNLAMGGVNLAAQDWRSASENAQQALSAVGLAADDCGARAWLLIHRALTDAVFQVAEEGTVQLQQPLTISPETVGATLDQTLADHPVVLDSHFFVHPEEFALLPAVQEALCQWLVAGGLTPAQAHRSGQRLPSYFVFALNNQWHQRPEEYGCLQQQLQTPFTQAAAREQSWNHYRAWLQKQVNQPLLAESFSLRDIHLPLRGYYEACRVPHASVDGQEVERQRLVVDLHTVLMEWLHTAKPLDAVRVLCGGPGSGKSFFARMFAARVAAVGNVALLLIPMHLLPVQADLRQAVREFAAADPCFRGYSPLEAGDGKERLLLILDGLDELAMSGMMAVAAVRQWLEEIVRTTAHLNQRETRLQVLLTVRSPLCASSFELFRLPGQVLHILSYYPLLGPVMVWHDPDVLLPVDQRPQWWSMYSKVQGQSDGGLPALLQAEWLAEMTAHPLLNYLLATMLHAGRVELFAEDNLSLLYRELVTGVFQRQYEGGRNPATKGVEEAAFVRILEEIAVAIWHGDGRTITVTAVVARCRAARHYLSLDDDQRGGKDGVMRLLTAFFFEQVGTNTWGEACFAFTHGQFAKFFIANRVVHLVRQLTDNLRLFRSNADKGWDETVALTKWIELCGPSELDAELFTLVYRSLALYPRKKVREWQRQLSYLIGHALQMGLPMAKLGLVTYKEMAVQAHHAEAALLAVLNACACHTGQRSPNFLANDTIFGAWLGRLQGQRTGTHSGVLAWLSYLDLSGSILAARDLRGANLQKSDLRGSDLSFANLAGADLRGSDLRGANLLSANLEGADLWGADLRSTRVPLS